MNSPFIQLKAVSKSFGTGEREVRALRDVFLTVHQGEMLAITGKSGAGKTTLLEILAGLVRPDRGQYFFEQQAVETMKKAGLLAFRRAHIGFVPQSYALLDDKTVTANVALPLRLRRWQDDKIASRVEDVLERFGLADRASTEARCLSGGEKQRVALARAVCPHPEVVLADEPTAALDADSQNEILSYLLTLNKDGTTIIVVTHDPIVSTRCGRTVNLQGGRLCRLD